MAFLTFAEAKVEAPPILRRKYPAHTVQIIQEQEQEQDQDHEPYKFKKAPPPTGGA